MQGQSLVTPTSRLTPSWSRCDGHLGRRSHLGLLLLDTTSRNMEHPLGQLSRLCCLPASYPPPNLLAGVGAECRRKRESLHAVQVLFSNSQNTGVSSTCSVTDLEPSTLWVAVRKGDSIPARLSTHVCEEHPVYTLCFTSSR